MVPLSAFDLGNGSQRVVELLGPAGCGKSTLLASMRNSSTRLRTDLSIWGRPRLALAATVVRLLPTLAASFVERTPLRAAEFMQMVRIECLWRQVRAIVRTSREPLVMDEGPLFAFAWLEVFFGALPGTRRRRWRHESLAAWSELFCGVIMLDASDQELTRRIRRRRKAHIMKQANDEEVARFSEQFRAAFRSLLRELALLRPDLRIARRRTDAAGAEETRVIARSFAGSTAGD